MSMVKETLLKNENSFWIAIFSDNPKVSIYTKVVNFFLRSFTVNLIPRAEAQRDRLGLQGILLCV